MAHVINKLVASAEEAISDITDGATILIGSWGPQGGAFTLHSALLEKGVKDLTIIGLATTVHDNLGLLVKNKQVKKLISGFPFQSNPPLKSQSKPVSYTLEAYQKGEIEIELVPFGTLMERVRCGGCGIPAVYLPTGVGTIQEEGKEKRVFNGREYLLETAITADFAFIHANKGDKLGNLVYRLSARAAHPIAAAAAKTTIAEVDEIVEPGDIMPDQIHTPGIYIHRVIKSTKYKITFD